MKEFFLHESSLAKDVMEIILETIASDITLSVKTVNSIQFSQSYPPIVVAESFEFYFEEMIKGTVLEGAELIFRESEKHGFFIETIDVD